MPVVLRDEPEENGQVGNTVLVGFFSESVICCKAGSGLSIK